MNSYKIYIYKYIYILGQQDYPKYIYICKNTILHIRTKEYITSVIIQKNIIYAPIPYDNYDQYIKNIDIYIKIYIYADIDILIIITVTS